MDTIIKRIVKINKRLVVGIITKDRSVKKFGATPKNFVSILYFLLFFQEWLWIAAVYLNAKIKIANILKQESENGAKIWEEALSEVKNYLLVYTRHIDSTPWSSLPELTNANGENCSGSCPAQAWSVGCLLEVMETLQFLVNAP
jgi:Holliday junction resolvase